MISSKSYMDIDTFCAIGDKSNHIPQLHIPQMYYFLGFTTFMGFPVLITRRGGPIRLIRDVLDRMFGGVK